MSEPAAGPKCIGIIMDGNRRFAKAQGLSPWAGHTAGYKKLKEVLRWAKDAGVETLIVYAFSTENWKRPPEEVRALLTLFKSVLSNELRSIIDEKIRVTFIGDRSRFGAEIESLMSKMEEDTKKYEQTLVVALSYGGRAEIVAAAEVLRQANEPITEATFEKSLYTAGVADPDLIIRTGGEQRLSNFLLWQSAYSELCFTKTLWPALEREEFDAMLADYAVRKRNFGS